MRKRRHSRSLLAFFAASAILLCLGEAAAAEGSAADRAWVLDTLKRYSPDGWYIVDSYRAKLPEGTDFMKYWEGGKDDQRWDSLNTIVHEISHCYASELALAYPYSYYYFISAGQSIMVPVGRVYLTKAMVPSFPEELRTYRFTYVDSDERLGSQVDGVYGLLDEMAAYRAVSQAAADMEPIFLANPGKAAWIDFFNSVDATLYGVAEFRFFVLKYILWARDREPAVYADIMANKAFKSAFVALDRRSRDFVALWLKETPVIYGRIREAGLKIENKVEDKESWTMIESGGETHSFLNFMDIYELLRREMTKPAYAPILAALYDGGTPADWPDSGVQPAARGNYDKE